MAIENPLEQPPRDDGLSPEEGKIFDQMQADDAAAPPVDGASAGGADAQAADSQGSAAGTDDAAGAGKTAGDAEGKAGAKAEGDGASGAGAEAAGAADDDDDDDGEAAAGAAGAADPAAGADDKPRKKGRVSAVKYRAEVEARTTAERERDDLRSTVARADERLRIINEALTAPKGGKPGEGDGDGKATDDPKPDKEKDVFAYLEWADRQMENLSKALQAQQQGQQEERQTSQAEGNLRRAYTDDVSAFAQREPNFQAAYAHLMESRVKELAVVFFHKDVADPAVKLTPQEFRRIEQTIIGEERDIVAMALESRQSPAARIYALARGRGFDPKAAAAAAAAANGAGGAPAAGAGVGNGAAKPAAGAGNGAAAAGGGKSSVAEEIARIKTGQDASMSLSNGGSAPGRKLDAKTLADMPQAEFDAMMDRLDPEEFRRIVEGQS